MFIFEIYVFHELVLFVRDSLYSGTAVNTGKLDIFTDNR